MADEPAEKIKKRGPGRPKLYPTWSNTERGAPKLVVRVDPDVYEHVTTRPEGARPYIEQLVRKDRDSRIDSKFDDQGDTD